MIFIVSILKPVATDRQQNRQPFVSLERDAFKLNRASRSSVCFSRISTTPSDSTWLQNALGVGALSSDINCGATGFWTRPVTRSLKWGFAQPLAHASVTLATATQASVFTS
jgi:hypothetical protein